MSSSTPPNPYTTPQMPAAGQPGGAPGYPGYPQQPYGQPGFGRPTGGLYDASGSSGAAAFAAPPGVPGYGKPQDLIDPDARRRRRRVAVILVCVGALVLVSGVGVVGVLFARLISPSTSATSTVASHGTGAQQYAIDDRPGWDPLVAHGQELSDKYMTMTQDGSIFEIVPQTPEGKNYIHDFLLLLADKNAALKWAAGSSEDPGELDAKITDTSAAFDELERTFLAGEDFGVDISVTQADGTTYTSDGANHTKD